MFFRIVRAAGGKGVQHEYVRLVESYREHGKPKQRVVCNLGRKDLLVANLDSLNRLLGAGEPADTERAAEQVAGADAWDWGPMLVTATLWRELGLEQILDRLGGGGGCRSGAMMGNGERVAPRGFAWSFANSSNGTERSTSCMPAKNRSRRSCFCACGICFRLRLTWCFTT